MTCGGASSAAVFVSLAAVSGWLRRPAWLLSVAGCAAQPGERNVLQKSSYSLGLGSGFSCNKTMLMSGCVLSGLWLVVLDQRLRLQRVPLPSVEVLCYSSAI
jgi:hypothetical protein